jgi:hypothetical protein
MPSTFAGNDCTRPIDRSLPLILLKGWLRGRWALLFSHSDDFASYGFEADRWVEQVREAFDHESVAALAVSAGTPGDGAGWITAIGGRAINSRTLGSLMRSRWLDLDAASRCAGQRFVMVLDGALNLRRTLLYKGVDRLPSPIDLASVAAVCRLRAQPMERRIA